MLAIKASSTSSSFVSWRHTMEALQLRTMSRTASRRAGALRLRTFQQTYLTLGCAIIGDKHHTKMGGAKRRTQKLKELQVLNWSHEDEHT